MKPIKLTVAGLHSFREKQEVDFDLLCEGGVFGIFGPTGSGKSTILDAMTLALYGKVERASNNTLGIMNHAEDQIHVAFTFELENANGKSRYTIERSFKRTDELRVRSSVSRIIEIGEDSVVLADKTRDVDQKIQELLGLTIDDFTRAVVLPQGKFAEFLSLKGADRRQMLQRLFNLEQYGDKLNKKLKARIADAKSELNEVAAEQTGLGDASIEAIKQAEKDLEDVEVLLEKRKKELIKMEEQFEQSKQIWGWQKEKTSILQELQVMEGKKYEILHIDTKLKRADIASKIMPYLEEYENAKAAVLHWTTTEKDVHAKLEDKKKENEKVQAIYQRARQEKAEKLPIYITKQQQLLDAKQIQEKMVLVKKEHEDLQKKLFITKEQITEKKLEIEKLSDVLTRGIEKQKKLKEEQATKNVIASFREEVRNAFEKKQSIIRDQHSLTEMNIEKEQKQQKLNELEAMLEGKKKELTNLKGKIESLFAETQHVYNSVCEKERHIEKVSIHLNQVLSEKRQQLDQIRTSHLAIELAKQLQDGQACPVCGSTEHPKPHKAHIDETESIQQEIENVTENISKAGELRQALSLLKIQLEQISYDLEQEYPGELKVQTEVNVVESSQDIQDVSIETKSLQQDFIQIREDKQKIVQSIRTIIQQISQFEHSIVESKNAYNEVDEKISALAKKLDTQIIDWKKSFPQLDFDTVEKTQEEISKKDEEFQELATRIEKSIPFIEEKQLELNKAQEMYNQLERRQVELSSTLKIKEETIQEYQAKLTSQIGDDNICQLLEETELMLKKLEENETATYETWEKIQQDCQRLQNEAHAATQSLVESKERSHKATQRWQEITKDTRFVTTNEVKEAILSQEEVVSLRNMVEQYQDKFKQLQNDLDKINQQLKGEEITEEKWREIQLVLEETKQMVNESVQARGAAVQILEDLRNKHARFNELQERRVQLENLVEQYHKLQTVFKGNSFVEFLAEEQLVQVARDASERLGILTRQRYAIEVDSQGGFIMRDDANGGVRRPVTTLSGGETFLTSLALALSLSAQIQLRGEYPLQFFFLDEGFGTLDADLLDTVVSALEKLHSERLSVGVITHVQELRARLPRRLIVEPAEHSGRGTTVRLETL